ncbi:MAG: hypothetical protein EBQ83_00230, partial [Burkholderiaceae bacterium]|nr:hypothetical protein [Burkholderiaceae bacterium]
GGTVSINAGQSLSMTSTALVSANAAAVDGAAGGQVHLQAPLVTQQSGALLQANGNNGPGGLITAQATQLNLAGTTTANGNVGGNVYLAAQATNITGGALLQANGNNGPGGKLQLTTVNDQVISSSQLQANGASDGGSIKLLTTSGDINLQSAIIQTNGSNGRGGSIGIAATNYTALVGATVEANGATQGGTILIGNDAQNGTLPFSIYTSVDNVTVLSAAQQTSNLSNQNGGFIETSGHTLNLLGSINAGRGGMWLLDPTNVTISSAASTGGNLTAAQGQATTSNFSTTDIQTAINAGTSVTIIASGTITQSNTLTFNVATAGLTPTLTLNNTSGSKQAITLIAMTDNSTGSSSGVSLNAISAGGAIAVNGIISLKGAITLDNTYGGTAGVGSTPTSGFITSSNASTLASTSVGVGITAAVSA